MERAFLYIDILGFRSIVESKSEKVENIFKEMDTLKVFKHDLLQVIVFSDTILIFNKDERWSTDYYITYLIEYAQELFYKLSRINVFFKGIITYGEFHFRELRNFPAYYGKALIDTYNDEKGLSGFGLYVNKKLREEVVVFDSIPFDDNYDYILLCQSFVNLYLHTNGLLPVSTPNIFSETDTYHRIDEDLRFFREIEYLKNNHPKDEIKNKYQAVYELYKGFAPEFFDVFEREGFIPLALNSDYTGSINFTEILAEKELSNKNNNQ